MNETREQVEETVPHFYQTELMFRRAALRGVPDETTAPLRDAMHALMSDVRRQLAELCDEASALQRPAPVTFMDHAVAGAFTNLDEAIEEAIGGWHNASGDGEHIAAWLGMTGTEYKTWLEDPSELASIVRHRNDVAVPLVSATREVFVENRDSAARASADKVVCAVAVARNAAMLAENHAAVASYDIAMRAACDALDALAVNPIRVRPVTRP